MLLARTSYRASLRTTLATSSRAAAARSLALGSSTSSSASTWASKPPSHLVVSHRDGHYRNLVSSAHKRALSKQQLEGKKAAAAAAAEAEAAAPSSTPASTGLTPSPGSGGGASTKPADVAGASGGPGGGGKAGGAGGGGGGGSALFALLALGGIGAGGAYYMGYFDGDGSMGSGEWKEGKIGAAAKEGWKPSKVSPELKEVVEEVVEAAIVDKDGKEVGVVEAVVVAEEAAKDGESEEAAQEEEAEEDPLEHPEDGNRVDVETISAFFETVSKSRAQQELEEAEASAAKATAYNESYETSAPTDAISELASTAALQNSKTLREAQAATAALRADLDQAYFQDLETLSASELKVRVVQLATEMADRTKWEAVRLKEFLAMKEKEVGEKYLETLQKQRLEFEALLAQKLREQEDTITRQANAALQAKEESIQSLLHATSEARDQETRDVIANETKRLNEELNFQYQQRLQNELGLMKEKYLKELEGHANVMKALKDKLEMLESRLEVSRNYESGSKKAHKLSAAALALANKLEAGEGAAVELAALKGAAGDDGVIGSALAMIPRAAENGVPTLSQLQATFDSSYTKGRQAAMVPDGRAGLDGQLLGILFAKLSVPPSPDSIPTSEEEGSVTDGILSLARQYVQLGDLEKAVEQLDKLKGQTAYVMSDWKGRAMDRVATERALKVIKLECALLNKDLVGAEL